MNKEKKKTSEDKKEQTTGVEQDTEKKSRSARSRPFIMPEERLKR